VVGLSGSGEKTAGIGGLRYLVSSTEFVFHVKCNLLSLSGAVAIILLGTSASRAASSSLRALVSFQSSQEILETIEGKNG
jgi:hypothetical protein